MKLNPVEVLCTALCLEGFLYGTISVQVPQVIKIVKQYLVLGLYSGIFLMYLQQNASKNDASKRNNIIFYILYLLYVLSMAGAVIDLIKALVLPVSKIASCLTNNCVNESCRTQVTSGSYVMFFKLHYSLAVTSSPNLFLYAQLEMPIIQIIHLALQRYTVVGSNGVIISVS